MYVGGTVDSVLIKEVSLFQRSLIERFHCTYMDIKLYAVCFRGATYVYSSKYVGGMSHHAKSI